MQGLELNARDDVEGVNNVTQTLAHFPAFGISDQAVAVDLLEGNITCHLQTEHNHSGDPEEKDIPTGLEDRRGI